VYDQPRRLVAPSYGFDLKRVLWHCLRARNITLARDSAIVGVLFFSLCVSPLAVLGVIVWLIYLHVGVAISRLVRDTVRQLRNGESTRINFLLARGMMLVLGLLGSVFGVYLIFALAAVLFMQVSNDPLTDLQTMYTLASLIIIPVALAVIASPVGVSLWRQRQIQLLTPDQPPAVVPDSPRLNEVEQQQRGNTVVYSGYEPFVGSGEIIDTWGFALRLVRASTDLTGPSSESQREFAHTPFTAPEIINHVGSQIAALTTDHSPEGGIVGLTVEDRVFLAGTEVSSLSPWTDPHRLDHIKRFPTAPARHYLACQVVSWRGELVTTVYVHFAVQGRALYLEVTTTALPPCNERYRIVDQVGGTGPVAYLRAFWHGLMDTPRAVWSAPLNLLRAGTDLMITRVNTSLSQATQSPGYDYGARIGVRELGAATMTRNHIQTQDIIKHKRMIERRVVASVLDFLEFRGVDTEEYRQRTLTMLNVGAMNVGSGSIFVDTATGQQNQNSTKAATRSRPGQ
jgi:hypothetical protein